MQHGVAGGYYLTFVFGGFVQTVGRLYRSNVRPLVLPKDDSNPTMVKHVYDILGTVFTVLLLNYTAAPFMLLGIIKSLIVWHRLGWYGHYIIVGSMAFFYLGGSRVLKKFHPKKPARVDLPKDNGIKTPSKSAPTTPGPHFVPPVDLAMKDLETKME